MESLFDIMFIVVPILVFAGFIFTFLLVLSPKLRGKFMSKQLKATSVMMKESKNSLSDLAGVALDIKKNILTEKKCILKKQKLKKKV